LNIEEPLDIYYACFVTIQCNIFFLDKFCWFWPKFLRNFVFIFTNFESYMINWNKKKPIFNGFEIHAHPSVDNTWVVEWMFNKSKAIHVFGENKCQTLIFWGFHLTFLFKGLESWGFQLSLSLSHFNLLM